MEQSARNHEVEHASFCCCGHAEQGHPPQGLSRREFISTAGAATAVGLSLPALMTGALAPSGGSERRPPAPRPLKVLPVFNCEIYPRKEATSWRVTGAIQNEQQLQEEERHIRADLKQMASAADFPLEIKPLITVRDVDQAAAATKQDYDVLIMYAARRNAKLLEILAVPDKWNLMFVRHRSGPLYYMYVGAPTHFLRKRRDEQGQPGMDVHDIAVDDHAELLWRLRACYGLKNLLGKRIVAIGDAGGWGADGSGAPDRARATWKLDIVPVSYEELGQRIQKAQQNESFLRRCQAQAQQYLQGAGVTLETPRPFVEKAFVLCEVFRDLLAEAQTDAITVNNCMSTIMPVSETTACLPLTLLNDEGYLAFCESDFVVIPSGILLRLRLGPAGVLLQPVHPAQGHYHLFPLHRAPPDERQGTGTGSNCHPLRVRLRRCAQSGNEQGPGGHRPQSGFCGPALAGLRGDDSRYAFL